MQTKRLVYIDLAKGVCMLLIVVGHTGLKISIPGLSCALVPLYFALSGYFFKRNNSFRELLLRKTNTLIIPFLFFYITAYLVFYLIKWINPSLLVTDAHGIMDLFNNRQFFNGPIWFLLALFWCNIFSYGIVKHINNIIIQLFTICTIGFIGWYLGFCKLFVPLFLDVAMTCMPFFAMGFLINKYNIIESKKYCNYYDVFFIGIWVANIIIEHKMHQRLSLHYNIVEGWSTYLLSFSSILCLLYICKKIQYLPILNYIGRFSLIILCVHHMIYRPLALFLNHFPILQMGGVTEALLTVLLSMACVPLLSKFFPRFVAQKDCITIKKKDY